MNLNLKGPILWAINPYELETRPDKETATGFARWFESVGLEIQPIYLAREEGHDHAMATYLNNLGVTKFLPPKTIVVPKVSRAHDVDKVLEMAREWRSPIVTVSSHGRSGVSRFVLGSFAESLLEKSPVPVLFLSHGKECASDISKQKIIFTTDYSEAAKRTFDRFLRDAALLKAEVYLFHVVTVSAIACEGIAYAMEDYFEAQCRWARHEQSRWLAQARALGLKAEGDLIEAGVEGNIGDQILDRADREKVSMISLGSHKKHEVSKSLLGSVPRDIFRLGRFPVLVYGPEAQT